MTDEQIKSQLKRLKIFGTLDEIEVDGYINALRNVCYTDLVNSVSLMISTYDKHRFPLPVEIIKTTNDFKSKEIQRNDSVAREEKYSGSVKATTEFAAAFRLCWLIKDAAKRKYFWENRLIVNNNRTTEQQTEQYISARNEIAEYLNSIGIVVPRNDSGTSLVLETSESDLGF